MPIPTRHETFLRLLNALGEAQSAAATMSHLHNTESSPKDKALATGWFVISEQLKKFQHTVIEIAKGKLH